MARSVIALCSCAHRLPYFLTKRVGMGPAAAATAATVFDVTGVLGSIATGVLVDKLYNGRMLGALYARKGSNPRDYRAVL